mmetsp:Transcript_54672/g.168368  ORF Transcript_54672/g.168368 Transcript_54672/m.168368 type:complete len:216 (-) Transcript_54672:336-983(-)
MFDCETYCVESGGNITEASCITLICGRFTRHRSMTKTRSGIVMDTSAMSVATYTFCLYPAGRLIAAWMVESSTPECHGMAVMRMCICASIHMVNCSTCARPGRNTSAAWCGAHIWLRYARRYCATKTVLSTMDVSANCSCAGRGGAMPMTGQMCSRPKQCTRCSVSDWWKRATSKPSRYPCQSATSIVAETRITLNLGFFLSARRSSAMVTSRSG